MAEIRLTGTKTPLYTIPFEIDEFVPVVKIDPANFKSAKLASLLPGPKVELSPYIDEALRTVDMDIVVAVPGRMLVTCTVVKGRKNALDDDGIVTPKVEGPVRGVAVEAMNGGKAAYGQAYQFSVDIVGNEERTFHVNLYASDDTKDANTGELKGVHCGRIEVRTWPDVFSAYDASRLIDEMTFIARNAAGSHPEYAGDYCMAAAERGLSWLLENKIDFYSVDRSHSRENSISFKGKGAKDRGDQFKKSGYVIVPLEFDEYVINHKLRLATKDEAGYQANKYDMVSLPVGSKLGKKLRDSVEEKPGFHVYYMSVTDDNHTLLLVIDSREPSNRRYEMYDQGGLTSSNGPLVDIETGFERQTSWVFLYTYKERKFDPSWYSGTRTRLWKIQRKL